MALEPLFLLSASIDTLEISASIYTLPSSSIDFSKSTFVSGSFVGNLIGTSSIALTSSFFSGSVVSSSFALTASYVNGQIEKNGLVSGSSFTNTNPSVFIVVFNKPFPNTLYSISVIGNDSRQWYIESQTTSSFLINTNSKKQPIGLVYWMAASVGEFVS